MPVLCVLRERHPISRWQDSSSPWGFLGSCGYTSLWSLSVALSPTKGYQVILTVVDHFSKSAHLIPKLPSAAVTGELLVQHFLWFHRYPKDIVSDCG